MMAVDLLDQAIANPQHLHISRPIDVDNINIKQDRESPTGTSKNAAIRRLRKDAPALHSRGASTFGT